jgi:hypothetical protein
MRYIFCLLLIVITNDLSAQKTRKAVFVIVDGIPADVIERLDPPALKAISKSGGYARAYVGGEKDGYSQTPTISAVGYNSLITGTWVNKHNVWDNDIKDPNYSYWNIFRLFEAQYPKKKTAIFSTWLDNRTKLIGSDAKAAGNLQPDYHFDGLELDTVAYPHDTLARYIHLIDEAVTDTAAAVIKRMAPDLSWIYLEYTDDMGHRYGDSPQMDESVMIMDKQLQRIWEAIQYREKNFNEEWQIYITTDHGRGASGHHHGGQSERERTTWIITNAKGLNDRFKKQQPGVVDIMPSIASFMKINIPKERRMEIDGVPMIGKLSATDMTATINGNIITITWKPVEKTGKAKIWLATTNNFKTGGKDVYKMIKEVNMASGRTSIIVNKAPSDFYKIVMEFPYNYLNRWVSEPKK